MNNRYFLKIQERKNIVKHSLKHFLPLVALALLLGACLWIPNALAEQMPVIHITLDKTTVSAGETITASWTITNEPQEYYVLYANWKITDINGDEVGYNVPVDGNTTTYTAQTGVKGYLNLTLISGLSHEDGHNLDFRSAPFTIIGGSGPLECELHFDKTSLMPGELLTVSWTISGDVPPYRTEGIWHVVDAQGKLTTHRAQVVQNSASFTPNELGSILFELSVTGSYYFKQVSTEELVIGLTDPLELTVSLDRTEYQPGEAVTATWNVIGGNPPYKVSCKWCLMDADEIIHEYEAPETNGTARHNPIQGGWIWFSVSVVDARNQYAQQNTYPTLVWGKKEKKEKYTQTMLNAKVNELAAACKAAAQSQYAQAKWFNDWLVDNAKYDYTYTYTGPEGVLLAGKGVCNSYATAYQRLLNKVGITNRLITGQTNGLSGWENHAWNMVNINGNWYHVDVTWNDSNSGDRFRYFLKSDQTMSNDHRWNSSRYPAAPYDWGQRPEDKTLSGDTNGDGKVDIRDLESIINYLVNKTPCPSMANADANDDEVVDVQDLVWIIDKVL